MGSDGIGGLETRHRIYADHPQLGEKSGSRRGHAAGDAECGICGAAEAPVGKSGAASGERNSESRIGFLRGGARPPTALIVEFIDRHKDAFGVEPICTQLKELGCSFAPSSYYEARNRKQCARSRRDAVLKDKIQQEYDENYKCYGARKMWLTLRGKSVDVARCTVERLMKELGLQGARRGQVKRTTIPDPAADRPKDLVKRNFQPLAPNKLWVADFTYVSTMAGWVYVAFVIDAYARRILGWKVSNSMTTDLVLDAINQAIFTRRREGVKDLSGLVHHNDAGAQYTSVRFTERLLEAGIDASIGSVGDAHDNSLAESINGLFKTELIKPRRPWRNVGHVEVETAAYLDWFNNKRLYEYCGDMPPAKLEAIFYSNLKANGVA